MSDASDRKTDELINLVQKMSDQQARDLKKIQLSDRLAQLCLSAAEKDGTSEGDEVQDIIEGFSGALKDLDHDKLAVRRISNIDSVILNCKAFSEFCAGTAGTTRRSDEARKSYGNACEN